MEGVEGGASGTELAALAELAFSPTGGLMAPQDVVGVLPERLFLVPMFQVRVSLNAHDRLCRKLCSNPFHR